AAKAKKILVIDIGGSNVKLMISSRAKRQKFPSGSGLTPGQFMKKTNEAVADWKFDAVAIGFPAPVINGRIAVEPKNLGKGWVRSVRKRGRQKHCESFLHSNNRSLPIMWCSAAATPNALKGCPRAWNSGITGTPTAAVPGFGKRLPIRGNPGGTSSETHADLF